MPKMECAKGGIRVRDIQCEKTQPDVASFQDGGMGTQVKECGEPPETRKGFFRKKKQIFSLEPLEGMQSYQHLAFSLG